MTGASFLKTCAREDIAIPLHSLPCSCCRYKTPLFRDIDTVGIKPDLSCRLGQDLPAGLPLDPEAALQLAQQIAQDSCVLAAEEQLEANIANPERLVWQAATHTWDAAIAAQQAEALL